MAKLNDFVFLRNPHEINEKEDPNKIMEDFRSNEFLSDHNVEFRKKLLSVQFSFFGNIIIPVNQRFIILRIIVI